MVKQLVYSLVLLGLGLAFIGAILLQTGAIKPETIGIVGIALERSTVGK